MKKNIVSRKINRLWFISPGKFSASGDDA